jgi:ABC-type uncharacterized transport system fused permease/ATPase subunit
LESIKPEETLPSPEVFPIKSRIKLIEIQDSKSTKNLGAHPLLILENVTLTTPQYSMTLFKDLSLLVNKGEHLLVSNSSPSLLPSLP